MTVETVEQQDPVRWTCLGKRSQGKMLALAELPVSLLHGSLSQQSHFSSYIWQHKWGKNLGKAKDY